MPLYKPIGGLLRITKFTLSFTRLVASEGMTPIVNLELKALQAPTQFSKNASVMQRSLQYEFNAPSVPF